MSDHTPGPWFLKNTGINKVIASDFGHIAYVQKKKKHLRYEADALLLSYAPEMLAVLKTIISAVDGKENYTVDDILLQIRRVVRLATGGQE